MSAWGEPGSGECQFNRPWGIAIDGNDDIYVADWGNDRVQKFSPEGEFLMRFGSTFDDGGKLSRPSAVAVDRDGDVYVTDWGNNRVQIYYADGDIIAGPVRGLSIVRNPHILRLSRIGKCNQLNLS